MPKAAERAQISPSELEFLQRIFDRVCMWCHIERPSERADRLASYLMDEFRAGTRDETALFDTAMWREANRAEPEATHEHGIGLGHTTIN
ncbi:hypothetical protein [Sinorhizobium sp. NFACC03]|uniref:hypothetical protein n=1 Tax=Sinorhizobium sp. NFACC03 TaxID=1566295 RepID=UPI000890F6A8|nr:hypothetical protein [Sinorhizobium sp. NFACC03]SDA99860.1 hypothetical protein SAMN03159448_06769 [Sinorhizobium sp. NFACC03]